MLYLLALLLPPLASRRAGGVRFGESLAICLGALLVPMFSGNILVGLLLLPISGLLWLIAAGFAMVDVARHYREGRVAIIQEAIMRARESKPIESVLIPPPPTKPAPKSYDAERDVWKIEA